MWYNGGMKKILVRAKEVIVSLLDSIMLWIFLWIAAIFLIWAINIFAASPQLANAIVATATVTLAIFAFWTIWQNYNFRKEEKEERLLNEIIEWAEAVANSAIGRQTTDPRELWKTKLDYKKHRTKGKLIVQIINSLFPELSQYYLDIDAKLDGAILFIEDINNGKIGEEAITGVGGMTLKYCETGIANSVETLFEEAAKIKTRDIG